MSVVVRATGETTTDASVEQRRLEQITSLFRLSGDANPTYPNPEGLWLVFGSVRGGQQVPLVSVFVLITLVYREGSAASWSVTKERPSGGVARGCT